MINHLEFKQILFREKIMGITIKEYSSAGKILRQKDLRQALYDAGEVLMEKVLVNLHGNEHKSRRSVESKILQPNFFRWYEKEVFSKTLQETIYPYLKEGKADLVDLAYRILLNLTADFSGVAVIVVALVSILVDSGCSLSPLGGNTNILVSAILVSTPSMFVSGNCNIV